MTSTASIHSSPQAIITDSSTIKIYNKMLDQFCPTKAIAFEVAIALCRKLYQRSLAYCVECTIFIVEPCSKTFTVISNRGNLATGHDHMYLDFENNSSYLVQSLNNKIKYMLK